jgi:hypothetical protein
MKRKDLYEYIREQIINELSEGSTKTFIASSSSDEENAITTDPSISSASKIPAIKALKGSKPGAAVVVPTNEMARPANVLKKGENFTLIKNIYAGSKIENILNIIEEAGEEGANSKTILTTSGIKYSQELSPILGELISLKAISSNVKTPIVEPELSTTTPEDEENFDFLDTEEDAIPKDEFEKPDDEEIDTAAISAATAGADQDMMPANKDIETINKIRDILIKKKDKLIKADEAGDDLTFEREKAALKQYINNNKSIISKNGELKRIISNIIDIK